MAAETERLREQSTAIYKVDPAKGSIDVVIVVKLTNNERQAFNLGTWGPLVMEELVVPRVSKGFAVGDSRDLPGLWRGVDVSTPVIEADGGNVNLQVAYTIDAAIDQNESRASQTPARVGEGYLYFCMVGQDTDIGLVRVEIAGKDRFKLTQSGTVMEPTAKGLKSTRSVEPAEHFTCVEGTVDANLATSSFVGPAEREIVLQAWPEADNWLDAAEANAEPALDAIHAFLGHDIPGEGPVVIRQAPPRSLGGYASAHDTPGIVQLDESAGVDGAEHELAHAWFGTDNFIELWLREGMAEWTATAMAGQTCPAATAGQSGLDLSDWQVVRPTADAETIDQVIADQGAAACGIVSAVAERMSEEQWREVIGSLLAGEAKYVGNGETIAASSTRVDFREWLDAVDERGLVPAGQGDPAFAANLDDLDFAQDLLADYGIPTDPLELEKRSEARARYHQFLLDAAPLGAPLSVREAMDNWLFDDAMSNLDKAYEVLDALKAADELLPDAGLIPFVQPGFESARNAKALDDVLAETQLLLESANEVFEPLSQLQAASPEGWGLPGAIRNAITQQRFEDILAAVAPALQVVTDVSAADEALPTAGLVETYRSRYESAATAEALTELAGAAAADRAAAEKVGAALDVLNAEAGDWQIPAVVTTPIGSGQIEAATAIVEDARAVVSAARAADAALPDADLSADIRPRFEAVTSAEQMAALRADAEVIQAQAEVVGGALASLSTLVPDWQIPAVVTTPIEERDFAAAAEVASAAQRWIVNAAEADKKLADIGALERVRPQFESAASLADLKAGADLAESWNVAAANVQQAIEKAAAPRDLLTQLGMLGTDVQPNLDAAIDAAVAGDVDDALNYAASVIDTINSGSSVGGLRLAGVVFFGVALAGVIGMWIMFRRQAGPPGRASRSHTGSRATSAAWAAARSASTPATAPGDDHRGRRSVRGERDETVDGDRGARAVGVAGPGRLEGDARRHAGHQVNDVDDLGFSGQGRVEVDQADRLAIHEHGGPTQVGTTAGDDADLPTLHAGTRAPIAGRRDDRGHDRVRPGPGGVADAVAADDRDTASGILGDQRRRRPGHELARFGRAGRIDACRAIPIAGDRQRSV